MIRFFDILFSLIGLIILIPLFIVISIAIKIESKGSVFYIQHRIGKNGKGFKLFKFRSMFIGSEKKGLITIGNSDSRITRIGKFIRAYKIDELPQLVNVLIGDMSMVGPRPEVKKYVDLYTIEQSKILNVRPGITDDASIYFRNENELLSLVDNPEEYYIQVILPHKINLNMAFINNPSIAKYFSVIYKTIIVTLKE